MNIVSQIKINGKWVDQDQIPKPVAKEIIRSAVCRGMNRIGFTSNEKTKEKTA